MNGYTRSDGRNVGELRSVKIKRNFTSCTEGSILFEAGETMVLCTARVIKEIPDFLTGTGKGWVHAEYNMLPGSTNTRKKRVRDARGQEIERLIARSLRAAVDLRKMSGYTIMIDCDVLQADGGTRTASITGGFLALHDAVAAMIGKELISGNPLLHFIAAVSVGMVDGRPLLDLCYEEDHRAAADLNFVMTEEGGIIEIQGTAEKGTFSPEELNLMIELGENGVRELIRIQKKTLSEAKA